LFCLQGSISDFVGRAESNGVLGFVCGEGINKGAADY
jgi:hypothetical protein